MNNRKHRILLKIMALPSMTLLFLAGALPGRSLQEKITRVDQMFGERTRTNSPGCALGVYQEGRILYQQYYGLANLDYDVPVKPSTVFMLGSISKQFTAACILLLQEEGRLSLDDDIRKYIPELPDYGEPIRIRNLIHHSSGIREYESLQHIGGELTDQGHHRNDDLLDLIVRQKGLNFKPGEKFQYCNSGYLLLAVIVERITGTSLGRFAEERIFRPLGMKNTFIFEDNRAVIKNRAIGYSKKNGGFEVDESLNESTGDGGVYTTVEDFLLWDRNFAENKIGGPDFIQKMLEPGSLSNGTPTGFERNGVRFDYASGLVVSSYRGLRTLGHGGAYVGFKAGYLRFPDQKFSVFLMFNLADVNPTDLCQKVADIFLEESFTENAPAPGQDTGSKKPVPVTLSIQELDDYPGDYRNEEVGVTCRLRRIEDKLFFIQRNSPFKDALSPAGRDAFFCERWEIKFSRDKRGRVSGFAVQSDELKGLSFRKMTESPPRSEQ